MSYLNAHNLRQRRNAQERYREIIEAFRAETERLGRFPIAATVMNQLGGFRSTFRDACKARPDLIRVENVNGSIRAQFRNSDNSWSGWSEWSKGRELSADHGRRIKEGQARAADRAPKKTDPTLKLRECLGCRSNGVKTMVLGGPGQRFCDPCRRNLGTIAMSEGCSSGRRVGLSGYSVTSQIQPRAT